MKNVILLAMFFVSIGHFVFCSEDSSESDPLRSDHASSSQGNANDDGDADDDDDADENNGDEDNDNSNNEDDGVADDDDDDDDDSAENGDSSSTKPQGGNKNNDDEEICNTIDLNLEAAPVRIMILQDLSSTMREGNPTKWTQAKTAITAMLEKFNTTVDFGFDAFPNGSCGVAQPPYSDTMKNNKDNIIEHINKIQPTMTTPLYKAIANYENPDYAPIFVSMGATPYLLVVSDGKDSCGKAGNMMAGAMGVTPAALSELVTKIREEVGVMTYVIGFGNQASPAQLNAIAKAGGTNVDTYFNAKNEAELTKALDEIIGTTVSCVYDIGEQDEEEIDLDKVNFYFDGKVVGLDKDCSDGNGWRWVNKNRTKIEFCKKACNKLKLRKVDAVTATFGCPTEIVQVY